MRTCLTAAALVAAGVMLATPAAAEQLATACEDEPWTCMQAPIAFSGVDALPIEWSFDTGWVPQGSPLQVHIWAIVAANTRVSLSGRLVTSWPHPDPPAPDPDPDRPDDSPILLLQTPGDPGGGVLGYHYGLDTGAQAKFEVKVGPTKFKWQGDIPYFPQIDVQVKGEEVFDAWGWKPGASSTASTKPQTLAQVDLAALMGANIPGFKGGFELQAALDIELTWINQRIVIERPNGKPVAGGDILAADDDSFAKYLGGGWVEYDVHPEGIVDYDGTVHLIPAFFIEILGQKWSIPVADIPISFPITEVEWTFDPQRVHVPLPDLQIETTVIDFGEVTVGQQAFRSYPLHNAGEAPVSLAIAAADPTSFPLYDSALELASDETVKAALRFTPKKMGKHVSQLLVASNDPDQPLQKIELRGVGTPRFGILPSAEASPGIQLDSGCGCQLPGNAPRKAPWLLLFAFALPWLRRRSPW